MRPRRWVPAAYTRRTEEVEGMTLFERHLFPKNSLKTGAGCGNLVLTYWNHWRSLGDSSHCFRRERGVTHVSRRTQATIKKHRHCGHFLRFPSTMIHCCPSTDTPQKLPKKWEAENGTHGPRRESRNPYRSA